MIYADEFFNGSYGIDLDFFSGVPCSLAGPLIERAEARPELGYIGAVNEGDALAVSIGAWLAGRSGGIVCQNSGLANAINPLATLSLPYQIPALLLVTIRGAPGTKDEPQHEIMGNITEPLLTSMGVAHARFPTSPEELDKALSTIQSAFEARRSVALLIGANAFADGKAARAIPVQPPAAHNNTQHRMAREAPAKRFNIIQRLIELAGNDTALVSTTGMCSRELFTLDDKKSNFYVVGGMGCALPIGLGIALNDPGPTVILDGDGALLMRMGSLATVGHYAPRNLIHVVLDNGAHDSTGGQLTVSPGVDFANIALSCGYGFAATCHGVAGFEEAYRMALAKAPSGPSLIRVHIAPGPLASLGRPTIAPPDVALRFKSFLSDRAIRLASRPGSAR